MAASDQIVSGHAVASRSVWMLAATGAVALHVAGVAVALGSMRQDTGRELGAPAIEIGVELMSPKREPTDLPVGPDTEAAASAPAVVEQKAVVEKTNLPQATPTETDDPYRVVSPNPSPNPKEVIPKVASVQAAPSDPSVASEATAVPRVEAAVQSPRSVAPSLGTGESALRERVTWQKELLAHFDKYKRYPTDRSLKRAQVIVSFDLDRLGHVLAVRVVKGSGDASFDHAAVAMLERANPVPPPPPLVADQGLTFKLPVNFDVKQR
jgi:TonB family protein